MIDQLFAILLFFFVGITAGSFLYATQYRLFRGEHIAVRDRSGAERSRCPSCKRTLFARDLVPLFSFAALRGRCRFCSQPISWEYPIVELIAGLICVFAAVRFGWSAEAGIVALYGLLLFFIFLYDAKYQLILDRITLPALLIVFPLSLFLGNDASDLLIGGLIGGGWFWIQYVVSRGKWIGGGDIRLGALMGFMLGWQQTIVALVLAYFGGALVAVFLLVRKKVDMQSRLPFGTFLTVATFICLLFGQAILDWYLRLVFLV